MLFFIYRQDLMTDDFFTIIGRIYFIIIINNMS